MGAVSESVGLLFKMRVDQGNVRQSFSDFKNDLEKLDVASRNSGSVLERLGHSAGLSAQQFDDFRVGTLAAVAGIGALVGIASTAAVGLFSLAKSSAEYGSAIFDASEKTNLGAETLSALKYAADTSGSSFENISKSVSKFAVLIGDAKNGNDKAIVTLRQYGITSRETQGALEQAITAIAQMKDADQQAAAAKTLFKDKTGEILPVIKSFSGDLPKLISELRKLGLVMSDEDARASDQFGDSLDTLSKQAAAAGRVFIGPLMRDITTSMGNISTSLSKNQTAVKQWGDSLATTLRGLKNVSSEVYSFMQTRPGAALSMFVFGNWIALNNALQAAAGPPPPLGVPVPQDFGMKKFDPQGLSHLLPTPKQGPTSYGLTDEEKQAVEDRAKAREEAFKKELAARSKQNALFLEAERNTYRGMNDQWEKAFLEGSETREAYQAAAINNVLAYEQKVKALLANALQIDSTGKSGTELENIKFENTASLTALSREVAAEKAGIEKNLTASIKKETDERKQIATDAARDELSNAQSQGALLLAMLQSQRAAGLITETTYAMQVGKIKMDLLAKALKLEQSEARRQDIENEIARQAVENSDSVIEAIKKEGAQYLELLEIQEKRKKATELVLPSPGMDKPIPVNEDGMPVFDAYGNSINYAADAIDRLKKSWDELKATMEASVGMTNIIGTLGQLAIDFGMNMANAVGQSVAAWALYGESIGKSLRKALAAQLAHIAAVAVVNALYATALGFLRLAQWDFAGAAMAFKSAAIWAIVGGVAAISAKGVAGEAFKQQTNSASGRTATGQGSGGGGGVFSSQSDQVIEQSRNSPGGSGRGFLAKLAAEVKLVLNTDGIFDVIGDNVRRSGKMRTIILEAAG